MPRARSAARYPVAFGYPTSHLSDLGIVTIVNLPVGNRLEDQPVFYRIYTLKRELKAMKPALGGPSLDALAVAEPGHLDLLIPGTHVIDPDTSPTGGAVVLLRGYTPVVDRAVEPLEPDGSLAPHQLQLLR